MNQRDRSDPFRSSPASSNHLDTEDGSSSRHRSGSGAVSRRQSTRGRRDMGDAPEDSESGTPPPRRPSARASSRPSQQTLDYGDDDTEDDGSADLPELNDIGTDEAAPHRRAQGRVARNPSIGATAFAKRRSRDRGHARSLRIPPNLAQSALISDQISLALIGTALFSLLLLWITIANRFDSLPSAMELRYGPEGLPSLITGPRALFRLPLLATIVTLMNVAVAWFISAGDRFAGRFIMAAAVFVHLLIWIAVAALVW